MKRGDGMLLAARGAGAAALALASSGVAIDLIAAVWPSPSSPHMSGRWTEWTQSLFFLVVSCWVMVKVVRRRPLLHEGTVVNPELWKWITAIMIVSTSLGLVGFIIGAVCQESTDIRDIGEVLIFASITFDLICVVHYHRWWRDRAVEPVESLPTPAHSTP